MEQRNKKRIIGEYFHRIITALILAGVTGIFVSINQNENTNIELVQKLNSLEKILEEQKQYTARRIDDLQAKHIDLQTRHNEDIKDLLNRVAVASEVKLTLASQHYTKMEVVQLVDRSIKPITDKLDMQTRTLEMMGIDISKIAVAVGGK